MPEREELNRELSLLKIELENVRTELKDSNDIINAIRTGEIDAIAVSGSEGPEIFTLKSADHTYRLLVEKMNEGAVLLNKRGEIIYSNSSFAKFLGRPIKYIIGTNLSQLIPQNYRNLFNYLFQQGWESSCKGEMILERQTDGLLNPYSFSFNGIESDDLLSIIITDISAVNEIASIRAQVKSQNKIIEEKQLQIEKEKESIAELERAKYILEGIPQITWTNLPSGEVTFFNSKFSEYTGQTLETSKNWNWQSFVHPEDLQKIIDKYQKALQTGTFFNIESRFKRASDATYRWHLNRALPIRNAVNEVTLWVGTATDIEEQKQSEEKFRFLAETVPQIFWTANPDGSFDYLNPRWYEYTGISYEDTKDRGWRMVLHPDDYTNCMNVWSDSLKTGKEYLTEYRFKRSYDHTYRWHLIRAVPLKNSSGEIVKWFGTFTDIDDQKEAINKLDQAKNELHKKNSDLFNKNIELQKINNDLDNFIYTASHDLKAPVSNIEGLIHALEEALNPDDLRNEEVGRIFDFMNSSIDRFKSTILDLTEISKIQKGDGSEVEPVNVCEIIEDVIFDIKELIDTSNVVINVNADSCPIISFSKKNLKSIVYNLLSNAVKYRSNIKVPKVAISTKIEEDYTVLQVEDNGLGIDLSSGHKLFTMFKRFHDHVEGTGIGLYLVKRIIDNAGGKIEVESKVGEGTIFKVYFKNPE